MRLFLTGSTGFIGSYVLRAALAKGYEVKALRRRPSSVPVIQLPCEPIWCDGGLESLNLSWFKDVDVVMHLASLGVSPRNASWYDLVVTNVVGSHRLFELAVEAGVRRFVSAGTSHEYGNTALRYVAIPPKAPLEPVSAYGASKAAAFQLLHTFAVEKRLEFFYGRIFTAYGVGQFSGNFWPSLRSAALSGSDFCMTSGHQISDFIPVSAVAEHLLRACIRPDIQPGFPLVVNIGSGNARSLLSFAQDEWNRLGATGRLLPGSIADRPGQIDRYVPDVVNLNINFCTNNPMTQ